MWHKEWLAQVDKLKLYKLYETSEGALCFGRLSYVGTDANRSIHDFFIFRELVMYEPNGSRRSDEERAVVPDHSIIFFSTTFKFYENFHVPFCLEGGATDYSNGHDYSATTVLFQSKYFCHTPIAEHLPALPVSVPFRTFKVTNDENSS